MLLQSTESQKLQAKISLCACRDDSDEADHSLEAGYTLCDSYSNTDRFHSRSIAAVIGSSSVPLLLLPPFSLVHLAGCYQCAI